MNAVGRCDTCRATRLVQVYTLFVSLEISVWWTHPGDWHYRRYLSLEIYVICDCPICGEDIDQYEMTS